MKLWFGRFLLAVIIRKKDGLAERTTNAIFVKNSICNNPFTNTLNQKNFGCSQCRGTVAKTDTLKIFDDFELFEAG